MSLRTFLLVLLALASGGSAAVGIKRLRNQEPPPKPDTVAIVVAAGPISRGEKINADSVTLREYPKELVPAKAITRIDDALERFVFIPLSKDEPVLDSKLLAKGAPGGLAPLIPKGMRAFTINTPNVASGVAGFILPGNRVDVLLTVTNPTVIMNDDTGGGTTTTLLQNVEILAVDQRVEAPADNKVDAKELRSVTLLVTPDQAAKLDLGQNKGTLHLSLRHPEDTLAAETRPQTLADLRFHQEKPWDERAKGLFAALAQSLAQMQKKEAVQPVRTEEPIRTMEIRTLRGAKEGIILLQTRSEQGNGN